MKKVVIGLMTVLMMVVTLMTTVMVINETEAEVNSKVEGAIYDLSYGEAYEMLGNWIETMADARYLQNKLWDDGYYRGYGIIVGNDFEKEHNVECTAKSIEEIVGEVLIREYDLSYFSVGCAGFHDQYAIYKMVAESETEPIGYTSYYSTETDDYVYENYCKGSMYFMVVYSEGD